MGTLGPPDYPIKIGIFHLSLNPCGGAERLALELSRSLKENNYLVELVVTEKSNWRRISAILGFGTEVVDREIIIPPLITLPTIYSKFFYWLLRDVLFFPLIRRRYDVTITTMQTVPLIFSDILYVQAPDFMPYFFGRCYKKYSTGGMRAYYLPFEALCNLFIKLFRGLSRKPLILVNSKCIQEDFRTRLNVNSMVVYPPVDTEVYYRLSRVGGRSNIVLTVSRIEEGKGLHLVPVLASRVRNSKFVIIGSAGRGSGRYVHEIAGKAEQLGVKDRVTIIPDATENVKRDLLSKAKIYLHTMTLEPFGMSIVEAMSSGLVPVVPRSGGPWLDILDETEGVYGYAYDCTEEASAVIVRLLENEKLRTEVSGRAVERAGLFDSWMFEKKIAGIVRRLTEAKKINKAVAGRCVLTLTGGRGRLSCAKST